MARLERYYRHLAGGHSNGGFDRLVLTLLAPISLVYALALRLRAIGYAAGVLRSFRLPRPVVSVGNLTVGGTGKTPTVALLASHFLSKGLRVAVLSRGYGSSSAGALRIVSDGRQLFLSPSEAGDEPYLLASTVPGLAVIIGADRYQAGLLAIECCSPDLLILDDGFQHLRLQRDLDILLLDGRHPFGNGLTLPAGLLREPSSAASRANLVIYTRCDGEPAGAIPGKPFCRAVHRLTGAESLPDRSRTAFHLLAGQRGAAFAGIADNESFFCSLREEGLDIVTTLAFPDHCRYGETDIAAICRMKESSGVDFLITTGKDATKLAPHLGRIGRTYVAVLELQVIDPGPLEVALEKLLQK